MSFKIIEYKDSHKNGILSVWEKSVKATHHFLLESDFEEYKKILQNFDFKDLDVFCLEEKGEIIGFIGIHSEKIEMLFLNPDYIGKGLGKQLTDFAFSNFDIQYVDVNKQNPKATKFYKKIGFETFDRKEKDDMGKPYPILKMKLKK
ncbi:GNAT family N-acetyltransferase [Epilithonimonas xixisoli]|uniref:Putative acetyltransferase n=1 Tax=Epilithonimonas xixisoli TaxID=1476462 RepID=A0A4R8ICY5_9FLAO|nr:GNAT family N-acetyltransferase [Epilithonimonas xixisoli]TDX86256.1 putative acetyltransferase [Epilithonimonas xixisoli]